MYLQITSLNCIMNCQLYNVMSYWIANCIAIWIANCNIYAPIVALCLSDGDCIKFCCRSTLEMASAVVPPSICLKLKNLLHCVGFVCVTKHNNELAMGWNISRLISLHCQELCVFQILYNASLNYIKHAIEKIILNAVGEHRCLLQMFSHCAIQWCY